MYVAVAAATDGLHGGSTQVTQTGPSEFNLSIYASNRTLIDNFVMDRPFVSGYICSGNRYNRIETVCKQKLATWWKVLVISVISTVAGLYLISGIIQHLMMLWFSRKLAKIARSSRIEEFSLENATVKGLFAKYADVFDKRQHELTRAERFRIRLYVISGRYRFGGLKWLLITVALLVAFEALFPSIVFTYSCTEPDCFLIPPTTNQTQNWGLKNQNQTSANVTWNQTHVIFETACGQEFYNAPLNISYTAGPTYQTICNPVNATILSSISAGFVSWCEGSHQPSAPISPQAQGSYSQQISEHIGISSCFWQNIYTTGFMQWYGTENAPNWVYCNVSTLNMSVVRTNGSSTTNLGTPVQSISTNPFSSMPNGFYTNYTHMIVLQTGNVATNLGNIAFNMSLREMAMAHWYGAVSQSTPRIANLETTIFAPYVDNCRSVTVFPKLSSWVEFSNPCQFATVTQRGQQLIFSARDTNTCTIVIGDSLKNTTITVGSSNTQTTQIFSFWSCNCSGQCNFSISVPVSSCVVNFTALSTTSLRYMNVSSSNVGTSAKPSSRQHSSVWTVIFWIIIALLGAVTLIGLICMIIRCCNNRRMKRQDQQVEKIVKQYQAFSATSDIDARAEVQMTLMERTPQPETTRTNNRSTRAFVPQTETQGVSYASFGPHQSAQMQMTEERQITAVSEDRTTFRSGVRQDQLLAPPPQGNQPQPMPTIVQGPPNNTSNLAAISSYSAALQSGDRFAAVNY